MALSELLYRLPEVIQAVKAGETVFICEGEKDVDRLRSLGLTATTNAGGPESGKNLTINSKGCGCHYSSRQ